LDFPVIFWPQVLLHCALRGNIGMIDTTPRAILSELQRSLIRAFDALNRVQQVTGQ
jgi:hypothetical protein